MPKADLHHYVNKSFAMLEVAQTTIKSSDLPERQAAEQVLNLNDSPAHFLCDEHKQNIKFINRTICNVYFNNAQKLVCAQIRKDSLQQFKHRRKKQRLDK